MITKEAYDNAVESKGGFDIPECGAYKCVIKKSEDVADKEYIKVEFDIVDGKYKGYAADCMERAGFCPFVMFLSYKEAAQGMFKHRIKAIESFNRGYVFDFDANKLTGKYFIALLQQKEYLRNNGKIGTKLQVSDCVSKEDYDGNNFKIPEKVLLDESEKANAQVSVPAQTPVTESELPF